MDIQSFLEIGVVSAVVSLVVAAIKHYWGTEGMKSVGVSIAVSLLAGAVYVYFKETAYWESFVQILMAASTIYGMVIKQVQEKMTS